ncbi:MAG TPA: phosphoglycerate mutase family protein [Allosphingosinicella sp.]|jgi:phosphohistidine phosphatase SixA
MPILRLLALSLFALSASAAARPQPPGAPDVYVMRHLQKGTGDDPGLSEAGRANAARLADWFGKAPPRTIFVSRTRRARETAAPLAASLGLTPQDYEPLDVAGVVARAKAAPGPVLIVGHSNTVPDVVAALGGARPGPIAEESFGQVWRVHGRPPVTQEKSLGGR